MRFLETAHKLGGQACGGDGLHREGSIPESAVAVALHLHAVLSQPQVVRNAGQMPARGCRATSTGAHAKEEPRVLCQREVRFCLAIGASSNES